MAETQTNVPVRSDTAQGLEQTSARPVELADAFSAQDDTSTCATFVLDLNAPDALGVALGRNPISAENPVGDPVRGSEAFGLLKAQIDAMQSLNGAQPQWSLVIESGASILERQSKDCLVGCYFGLALFKEHGFRGLHGALEVIIEMVSHHWTTLHPTRKKARLAAFEWFTESLAKAITAESVREPQSASVTQCIEHLTTLDGILQDDAKLGPDGPSFSAVRSELKRGMRRAQPGLETQPSTPTASPRVADLPFEKHDLQLSDAQDVKKIVGALKDPLRQLIAFKRNEDLGDPAPYRLLRIWTWLGIERLPPNQGGKTSLSAIDEERRDSFDRLLSSENYAQLIKDSESRFTSSPYWLDAHRFSACALSALGHDEASAAVVDEVRLFVQRLEGIDSLQFSNGTPLADERTLVWLEETVTQCTTQPTESPVIVPASDESAASWELVAQRAVCASEQSFEQGLRLFVDEQPQSRSKRELFLWDLAKADYCVRGGHLDIAIACLEHLDDCVHAQGLDEWEPELSVQVAQRLYQCYQIIKSRSKKRLPNEAQEQRFDDIKQRICRLAPLLATQLFGTQR